MSRLLFECHYYEFHAIAKQVDEFARRLSPAEWAKFAAAASIFAESLRTGRPPAGRSERVRGSSIAGLRELKITMPGSPGPQLRVLYVREGKRILCARGIVKRTARIPRREIELAERAVRAYREAAGERRRSQRR